MGNNPSRNGTYEQYYDSIKKTGNGGDPNSTELDVDPYEVFGLSKNFEWEELKLAYRRVAKLVHPDKGGSDMLFKKVSDCFRILAQEYKARQADKPFYELRNQSRQYSEANPVKAPPATLAASGAGGSKGGAGGNFLDKFNRAFEDNRFEDDDATIGYGHLMDKSSKVRGDVDIPKIINGKFNSSEFNRKFDETTIATAANSKQLKKYTEPEALPLAKKIQYTELGGDKPDDFSSTNEGLGERGLQYTDYMVAYTTSRLVDPRNVASRKEYKSVSEYEKSREKAAKKGLTDAEIQQMARQKEQEARAEEIRLQRLAERDRMIGVHHDRVNRIMLR